MSVFGSIMSKIFTTAKSVVDKVEHPASVTPPTEIPPSASAQSIDTPVSAPGAASSGGQASPSAQPVDVEAVLAGIASQKGGGGNWRTSIVDLLKLLDLDSSLNARKELAAELNVHAGADGSAEENIALYKAVMQKLAENGGKVPENLENRTA
jgi:hypothetical protein